MTVTSVVLFQHGQKKCSVVIGGIRSHAHLGGWTYHIIDVACSGLSWSNRPSLVKLIFAPLFCVFTDSSFPHSSSSVLLCSDYSFVSSPIPSSPSLSPYPVFFSSPSHLSSVLCCFLVNLLLLYPLISCFHCFSSSLLSPFFSSPSCPLSFLSSIISDLRSSVAEWRIPSVCLSGVNMDRSMNTPNNFRVVCHSLC